MADSISHNAATAILKICDPGHEEDIADAIRNLFENEASGKLLHSRLGAYGVLTDRDAGRPFIAAYVNRFVQEEVELGVGPEEIKEHLVWRSPWTGSMFLANNELVDEVEVLDHPNHSRSHRALEEGLNQAYVEYCKAYQSDVAVCSVFMEPPINDVSVITFSSLINLSMLDKAPRELQGMIQVHHRLMAWPSDLPHSQKGKGVRHDYVISSEINANVGDQRTDQMAPSIFGCTSMSKANSVFSHSDYLKQSGHFYAPKILTSLSENAMMSLIGPYLLHEEAKMKLELTQIASQRLQFYRVHDQ